MKLRWTFVLALLVQRSALASTPAKRSYDTHDYYALEHDPRAGASLDEVVRSLGVELVERVGELQDHWLVRTERPEMTSRSNDPDPVLSKFNTLRARASSGANAHVLLRSEQKLRTQALVSSLKYLERQVPRQRTKRAPPSVQRPSESSSAGVAQRLGITDPMFSKQWHLVNDENAEHMMNVVPVWEMGLTGKGIISSLVDDGLDYTSADLKENFDADDSYDFNDHEPLPTPKNFDDHHGTRCAGQIAAGKNNACGVGIAYNSKVAGVRILSGPISDVDEAAALNYGFQNVSIYSCSWGPPDNGQAMEGPGYLIKKAVVNGINNGRGGKGSIFVFASGNGAANGDQCNFDGYTNSIYSVTVAAVDYKGLHPYYSEPCAANMVVAYSSGSGKNIVTTDKGKNECTQGHGGTSAAAPNAVGVIALALEARPDLTWRDVQHLCVESARMINPDDPDWEPTATGKLYSYKYGYGVLDATRFITAAKSWKLVKPQAWFETPAIRLGNGTMTAEEEYSGGQFIGKGGISSTMTITKEMLVQNNFETLEHINVKVWIDHTTRGDVEIEIISPNGVTSVLAKKRSGDRAHSGFPGWMFMSVKHWGEDPVGNWTIKVTDQHTPKKSNGTFLGWNMKFWGSTIDPSKARKYEVPLVENVLPVHIDPPPLPSTPTTTKVLTKPTAHLPDDHGSAPGENTNPAFSSVGASGPTGTPNPTADVGWFPSLSNLVANQKWFFGAVGAVALFGIGMGVFFWRRRKARLANYSTLPAGDDLSMSALATGRQSGVMTGGNRPTRELYDAFGEVSDDDDDNDENTALRGTHPQDRVSTGLGFHSGFLDDDEPSTAGGPTPVYRDEPEPSDERKGSPSRAASPGSPSGSGGSWEHAS
ncbi:putative kex protein [Lyophyllum shimeji]|uniref:Kex protein n=1 Tax=Lyophyllum shimeji TaxID=47721 RepID=A0A9P3UI10_LYOSH|nr:putative kex protein [Lyophyllum shimeji]